jgi:hypothetical protein
MSDLNKIGEELFNKIRGRFPSVTIGNESGEIVNEPTEARYFNFKYQSNGENLGEVSIGIDTDEGLTIIYSKDFIENQTDQVKTEWYNFLKEMRQFAKKRLLQFDVRDITKSNLNKRDYQFLAQRSGDSSMNESTMYGTNKTSYQRVGGARIAIKHTAPINTESVSGRTQKIGSIFIESPDGERFRYPYRHLSGARAMARHVAEGGTAYDEFGQYISSLSEELSKLRKFNTYMNRSGVMAETLGGYTDIVKERAAVIRKEIQGLQKENYYREAREGFTAPIVEAVPEDVSENWIDQLTIKQFNEELKDVFPYIYKLVGEATRAKEIGPDDLDESDNPCWKGYKQIGMKKKGGKQVPNCVPEEIELEAAFESMMGQFGEADLEEVSKASAIDALRKRQWRADDFYSEPNDQSKADATRRRIQKKFGSKIAKDAERGVEIDNKGRPQDTGPTDYLDAKSDVYSKFSRPNSKKGTKQRSDYMKLQRKRDKRFDTKFKFDNDESMQLEKAKAHSDLMKGKTTSKEKDVEEGPFKGLGKMMMKRKLKKDMSKHDDDLDDILDIGGTDDEFAKAYDQKARKKKALSRLSRESNPLQPEKPKTPLGEFILSYFDRETGKFPKGETAVLTAVEKDYGDEYVEPARQFIEKVESTTLEYLQREESQSRYPETAAIKRLAGI